MESNKAEKSVHASRYPYIGMWVTYRFSVQEEQAC